MAIECTLDVQHVDGGVGFVLEVENVGSDPEELSFSDARKCDVVVLADGSEVWRWSETRMFAQMLESRTLAPGQTETYKAGWEDPNPGDYEAVATLAATGHDCEARATFSV